MSKKKIIKKQSHKDPAAKYDAGKLRYDLVPPEAFAEVVKIYNYGAKKYPEPRNWEKGMSWGRLFGAIMRHTWAWWRGEDIDPESGLPHLAHAAWSCIALLHYSKHKKEFDDRVIRRAGNNKK